MLQRFLPLLLLLLPHQLQAESASARGGDGEILESVELITELTEVCQFVHEGKEKILDAAAEGDMYEYEEFLTEWIVDVPGGREMAEEIAQRLGFINQGQVRKKTFCISL